MEREATMNPDDTYDVVIAGRFQTAVHETFTELKRRVFAEAARLASQRPATDTCPNWITEHDLISAMKSIMPAAEDCLVRRLSDETSSYVRSAS